VQLVGDFVGKRYATYTDDLDIPGYFLLGLNVSGKVPLLSPTARARCSR
jgi:hypothetical protein